MGDDLSSVFKKVTRKGRTKEELAEVICWLTQLDTTELEQTITSTQTLAEFFAKIKLNPKANLIKGKVCGIQVEALADSFLRKVRYLDKLVDELAQGKPMVKVLRT